ncbi:MAG: multiheme c-type cytochrome [bacterium]
MSRSSWVRSARRWLGVLACLTGLFLASQGTAQDEPAEVPVEDYVWNLKPPAPLAEERLAQNPVWREVSCAQCHEEIAREWSLSLHALAWLDEIFLDELSSVRRKKNCYGCHAPLPMLGKDWKLRPEVRPMWRDHGVDCRACHLGPDGAIHGPFGAPSNGHASVRDEIFSPAGSNELCISCHRVSIGPVIGIARDFEDQALASRGLSCVGCHMAPVERSMAIDDITGEPLPPRKGRSHLLQTPRDPHFLAQAFRLAVERTSGGALFSIHNRAGHRIPGIENRRLVFEVELLDERGKVLVEGQLLVTRREFLPFDSHRSLALEAPSKTKATHLRLHATHDAPAYKRPVLFLEAVLEID